MRRAAKLGLAAAAAALVLLPVLASASASPGGAEEGSPDMTGRKATLWNKLRSIPELDDTQRYFVMLTAYGEGNYNPRAHNGSASERAASARAADNNQQIVQRAMACGVPYENLRTGSWTMFQLLAPYVSGTAFEIFGDGFCPWADPTRIGADTNAQICIAIEHAHDLQQYDGWKAFRTIGNLRLGWAAPALMGYISDNAARLGKYRAQARKQGFPPGIVDALVRPFPSGAAGIYQRLQSGAA